MKIKEIMPNIRSGTFIEDYCKLKGIGDIENYLNPTWDNIEDNENYQDIDKAFELFDKHVLTDSVIVIISDPDIDGEMSSALIYNYTKSLSPNQTIIVLFHDKKIHGINYKEMMDKIISAKPNLLIIPDAGTNDATEINQLIELGIDVLVLDHHDKEEETILDFDNDKAVVVNNQLSPNVVNKGASGTVVTFKFCLFCDYQYGTMEAINYLDLCAFSLVADICDCKFLENRLILDYGLSHINNKLLQRLVEEFAKDKPINHEVISWNVNPKINGIIRNDNIQDHIDIFTALTNPNSTVVWKKGVRATEEEYNIVEKVITQCSTRTDKKIQDEEVLKFMEIIVPTIDDTDNILIVIDKYDLSHSLTGLVASKLSSQFNKPCIIIRKNEGIYKGSLRSSVPMKTVFVESGLFEYARGHEGSCGVCFKSDNFNSIKQWASTLEIDDRTAVLKSYRYDSIPSDLFPTITQYTDLYCKGFEKPLFHIKPFNISNSCIKKLKGQTMKISLDGISCMKFMCSNKIFEEFHTDEDEIQLEVELIVELSVNEWNGYVNNQFIIRDYSVKEKIVNKIDDDDYDVDDFF